MADNLIKISELIPTTELKSADRIPIEQDGQTRSIKGAVLEQNLIDKTDARYIENAQKGAPNGIAPLDANGKVPNENLNFGKVEEGNSDVVSGGEVYESIKNYSSGIRLIDLSSEKPSQDGIFQPIEVGLYPNYGNLELTQEEKDSSIVYFYLINGVFSKETKSVSTVDVIEPNNTNAVSSKAVYDWSVRNVGTIAELRTLEGKEGQTVNLLGYYEVGDKPSLLYKWVSGEAEDDGGSIIIPTKGGGYWEAQFSDGVDVRDFGVLEGQDITLVFNKIILLGFKIKVPKKKYKIDADVSLNIVNDSNIHFDNTVLSVIPTNQGLYKCLNFEGVSNVVIKGHVKILGDKETHLGTSGEWGMGIYMRSSSNVYIQSIECSEMWGDGAYFGKTNIGETNKNIVIDNFIAKRNRRQGISVISMDGLIINKAHITDTKGALPQAGVDFEPNNKEDVLRNIVINNLYTKNNVWAGVTFDFQKLTNESEYVDININNHHSENEEAVKYSGGSEAQGFVKGKIAYNNLRSENAPTYGVNIRRCINYPDIIFNDPIVVNPNRNNSADDSVSAFSIYMIGTDPNFEDSEKVRFTNITINNPKIFATNNLKHGIVVRNFTAISRKKIDTVSIIKPFIFGFQTPIMYDSKSKIDYSDTDVKYLENGYTELPRTNIDYWFSQFSNKKTTANSNIGLGNNNGETIKTFLVENNVNMRITFVGDKGYIVGFNEVNASNRSYIESDIVGSWISIKCIDIINNVWAMVGGQGVWRGYDSTIFNLNASKSILTP